MGRPKGSMNKKRGPVPIRKRVFAAKESAASILGGGKYSMQCKGLLYDAMHLYAAATKLQKVRSIAALEKTSSFLKFKRTPKQEPIQSGIPTSSFYGIGYSYKPGDIFRERMATYATRENLGVPAEYADELRSESYRNIVVFYTYDEGAKNPMPKAITYVPYGSYGEFWQAVALDDRRRRKRYSNRFELLSGMRVPYVRVPKLGRKRPILGVWYRLKKYAPKKMMDPEEFPTIKPFGPNFFRNITMMEIGIPYWWSHFNKNERRPLHDRYAEIHTVGLQHVNRMRALFGVLDSIDYKRIFTRRAPQSRRWK